MEKTARFRSIDCLTIIEQRLPALTGASRRVAEAIVRDPWAILGMTIYDVADAGGVSLPSVTRFCRAVGYPGFRELVQGIAQSLGRTESKDLEALESPVDGNGLQALAASIVKRQVNALETTVRTLDFEAIEQAVEVIANARRVSVIGHGGAHVPAAGVALKLNWAGVPAVSATPDLFSNHVIAVDGDDVIIGISHQGRTRETVDMITLARSFGAATIGISTVPQSPLGNAAEISISALTPEVARSGVFLIALDTIMMVADVLAAAVADRKWNGPPPHRADVVEWIETNLRVGPIPHQRQPARTRVTRRGKRQAETGSADA